MKEAVELTALLLEEEEEESELVVVVPETEDWGAAALEASLPVVLEPVPESELELKLVSETVLESVLEPTTCAASFC